MKLVRESHQHGDVICESAFPQEAASLKGVFGDLQASLYEITDFTANTRPKRPKRHQRTLGGVDLPFLLPVNQTAMNREIKKRLQADGWTAEPVAAGPMAAPQTPLNLKGDFVRNRVFVEVEFGNVASMHRDFFKFQIANRSGAGDVGVLVVATERFARFFDTNVATFETARRNRPYLAIGVQMPIWIIGIEPDDFSGIAERYEAMGELCASNGLECHPVSVAMQASPVLSLEVTED